MKNKHNQNISIQNTKKNLKEKIMPYMTKNGIIILLCIVVNVILSEFLCAIGILISKNTLSYSTISFFELISSFISVILLCYCLSVKSNGERSIAKLFHSIINQLLSGGIVLAIILWILNNENIITLNFTAKWRIVFLILMGVIICITFTIIFIKMLVSSNISEEKNKFPLKKHLPFLLKLVGITIVTVILSELLCLPLTFIKTNNLFASHIFLLLLSSLIKWICYLPLLNFEYYLFEQEKNKENNRLCNNEKLYQWLKYVINAFAIIVVIISFIKIYTADNNKIDKILSNINEYVEAGDLAFSNGDIGGATIYYDTALARLYAWQGYYGNDDAIKKAKQLNDTDDIVSLLVTLSQEDAITLIKQQIYAGQVSSAWGEALLSRIISKTDPDTRQLASYFVQNRFYTKSFVDPIQLNENEKKVLLDKLNEIYEPLNRRNVVKSYYETFKDGGSTKDSMKIINNLSEENPDDIYIQYFALETMLNSNSGSSVVVDRYVTLITPILKEQSKEKIIEQKELILSAYVMSNNTKKAMKFLEDVMPEVSSVELDTILVYFLYENKQYDLALQKAKNILETDPNNADMLLYCALATLKSDLDISIDYALRLATLVYNEKEYSGNDQSLGTYTEYLTGFYAPPDSTFVPYYNYYTKASDEQKQKLNSNKVLASYIASQNSSNKDATIELETLLNEKPNLVYGWYLRGKQLATLKDWKGSLDAFIKSKELDDSSPWLHLEMAFTYEALGDLPKSLECLEKTKDLIDIYGVAPSYNYNGIGSYLSVYINNAKHNMYHAEEGVE